MSFDDANWATLISRIQHGQCMPIIGAGASFPRLPLGDELARELKKILTKHSPPEWANLEQVAEYINVESKDGSRAKEAAAEYINNRLRRPVENAAADPHVTLAQLAQPIYLTTNYDNLLKQAFGDREIVRETCRWNSTLLNLRSAMDGKYEPTRAKPLVFHLHGLTEMPKSMVLSEDDYLDFLVNLSRDLASVPKRPMLPICVRDALKNFTLLFVGYSLKDINFRVILRGLLGPLLPSERCMSLTVQFHNSGSTSPEEEARLRAYLEEYFGWTMRLQVYWGTASDFMRELQTRLAAPPAESP